MASILPVPYNRRVLVVDDEEAIREIYRRVLTTPLASPRKSGEALMGARSMEFEVAYAANGSEGLELVRKARDQGRPFAVAFVDRFMGDGPDGIETIRSAWKIDPWLEQVLCTGKDDGLLQTLSPGEGPLDQLIVLNKPFSRVELRQLALALTEKWRLRQQKQLKIVELESVVAERTADLKKANGRLQQEIAERKRVETELLHASKLQSVGQLAAGIAHEINTPTQFIGDNTEFLSTAFSRLVTLLGSFREVVEATAEGKADPEAAERISGEAKKARLDYLVEQIPRAIEQSLEGVKRISGIVAAMKKFSHPGGEEKKPTDLNNATENTLTVARNEWKYVADIDLRLDDGLPLVPCLEGEINQVLLNVIVNAAHAIAETQSESVTEKGSIVIETRVEGQDVVIRIADSGCGIPEALLERVFDPFFTTKDVGKGTGQGLAIAHSVVVDKHGGKLQVTSSPGEGATFLIRLPIVAEPSSNVPEA